MIDILSSAQVLLREANYTTRLVELTESQLLCFEDNAVLGFCHVFEDAQSLLERWSALEALILNKFAVNFRGAGDKAWNVYCVWLCGGEADSTQARAVRSIEENLDRTRKIAGCAIDTREELVRILLPLLPLQYTPSLRTEDATERLQKRINSVAPTAATAYLDESVPPADVVHLLGRSS